MGDSLLQSQETLRNQIKNYNENEKFNFTQNLMNFAHKIQKRWLVDGLIFALEALATESAKVKIALLDQFIPLIQLIQETCTQKDQDRASKEIFRLLDALLYDPKATVKEKAIDILLDARNVVQNDDKQHIMALALKLAGDQDDFSNRVAAVTLLNKFAPDMGQTLCEGFIVPQVNFLGIDEVPQVRITVARNLINISRIVSFDFFQSQIFPLYEKLT